MTIHKSNEVILRILIFGHFMTERKDFQKTLNWLGTITLFSKAIFCVFFALADLFSKYSKSIKDFCILVMDSYHNGYQDFMFP